jgi:hypothetical protein
MTTTALRALRAAAFVAPLLTAGGAAAQVIPSEPVTFGAGRVVIGGDAAVSVAPEDHGFFNYSDYEQSTLRQVRLGMSALVRLSDRVSLLGELRSENFEYVKPFAIYARIRPLPDKPIDIQIGRIPPTFGSPASRRTYGHDNPLIGSPLAYQYLTSLRADSAPADEQELLRMRGRGWSSSFSVGNPLPDRGVPLVSAFTWDTGVQVSAGWNVLTTTVAVTTGTASNPRVSDDNPGKQVAVRATATPTVGLTIGGSLARGEFLDRHVRALLPNGHHYDQRAAELDVEYSRDHWLARAETVFSEWTMPIGVEGRATALRAIAASVEGRYTVAAGVYGAARVEHLGFSRLVTPTETDEWEAPVTRIEVGGGYYVQRNLIAKSSLQFNRRDGGRVRSAQLLAFQLLYWF